MTDSKTVQIVVDIVIANFSAENFVELLVKLFEVAKTTYKYEEILTIKSQLMAMDKTDILENLKKL